LQPDNSKVINYFRETNRDAVGYIRIVQFLTKLLTMYAIIDFSYEDSVIVINNQS